jgi:hypothetical protein
MRVIRDYSVRNRRSYLPGRGSNFSSNAITAYRLVIYACFFLLVIARSICRAAVVASETRRRCTKGDRGVGVFIMAVSTNPGCSSVTETESFFCCADSLRPSK